MEYVTNIPNPYKIMSRGRDGSYSAVDTMNSGVILPPNTPPLSQLSASHALEAGLGLVKTLSFTCDQMTAAGMELGTRCNL